MPARILIAASALVAVAIVSLAIVLSDPDQTAGATKNQVVVAEDATGKGVFAPEAITIATGDSVEWSFDGQLPHTVTSDTAGAFSSGILLDGAYEVQFNVPGTYAYYCSLHGAPGGVGHSGTVEVIATTATPPPTDTPIPEPTATPMPRPCLSRAEKFILILGIVWNWNEAVEDGNARLDLNDDGLIGRADLFEVLRRPTCRR